MLSRSLLFVFFVLLRISVSTGQDCYSWTGDEADCHQGLLGDHSVGTCFPNGQNVACVNNANCSHMSVTYNYELGFWDDTVADPEGFLLDWESEELCWKKAVCFCHQSPNGSFCMEPLVICQGQNATCNYIYKRYLLDEWCGEGEGYGED